MPKDTVPRKFLKTESEYKKMPVSELRAVKDSLKSYTKPAGSGYSMRNATVGDYVKRVDRVIKSKSK